MTAAERHRLKAEVSRRQLIRYLRAEKIERTAKAMETRHGVRPQPKTGEL